MRPLQTLFVRRNPDDKPVPAAKTPGADTAIAAKPRPKRCLNEGAHKLYR